ncbi:hypothetical protein LOD99_11896 [Oopsacas minuta]|uniref:DUF4371 domain-containing protein n=1 Tax=Oopsacas minuta TaxID=111878 RepID=A0AAV7JGY8_9METZ|nr:hypothetical protein LOD99_11896 [Oopsacas minuta]
MKPSKKGVGFAFCTICQVDICISGGGKHEVDRHLKTAKHKSLLGQVDEQPSISTALVAAASLNPLNKQVMSAEIYFSLFVAEHNLPFLVADHFTHLTKVMFPDSHNAQSYSCARTKTTAIITHALAPSLRNMVSDKCRSEPFSILCDGGNDMTDHKYFTVLVRYWCNRNNQAMTRFLAMPICNIATAQNLFDALSTVFEKCNLPWENVIGFASDTANVMVGARNSVLSRIGEKQPRVFGLECLCHLAHLCGAAALKSLPISVDVLLIDVFYHFKYSAK